MNPTTCRDCGQRIIFGFNRKTKNLIPLNPTRDPAGNQAGYRDVHGTLTVRIPTPDNTIDPWEHLYMPHAATCPSRTASQNRHPTHQNHTQTDQPDNVLPLRKPHP